MQGVFAQNPDRIFVAMRGELPDLAGSERQFVDFVTAFGIQTHLEVPGRGMYGRNASVGDYASPGEATNVYKGTEGKDYQWKHVISVYDSQGNVKEAWTQWDSLFKPDDPNKLSQGRVHKILISPYDPEKRVWAIDDGHEVIRIFSNDGKKLLQTIGTLNTTTERNAKMTGNTGRGLIHSEDRAAERNLWPTDGHCMAAGWHLLRHRRLRRNARREIRQERQIPDGLGRARREGRQREATGLL